ncbi:MAG: NUDIX hydrolase [Acidobacteriaceae bacterium]
MARTSKQTSFRTHSSPASSRRASTSLEKQRTPKTSPPSRPFKLTGRGQTVSSKTVYSSKTFWVTQDEVREPCGVEATREVIRHNGSVVVLAVDDETNPKDPSVLLIRQYRHAAGKILIELPAGRIEPGEKLIAAGKRELLEETGYRARRWSRHANYYASPGFLTETMTILLAEGLSQGEAEPEEDEKIEVQMTPLSEVMRLIHSGRIEDGKTLIGVLLYHSLHRDKSQLSGKKSRLPARR